MICVPSLTEEICAGILNSIHAFKRQQDETSTTFSPCIQISDHIVYEYALWVKILYTTYKFKAGPLEVFL